MTRWQIVRLAARLFYGLNSRWLRGLDAGNGEAVAYGERAALFSAAQFAAAPFIVAPFSVYCGSTAVSKADKGGDTFEKRKRFG